MGAREFLMFFALLGMPGILDIASLICIQQRSKIQNLFPPPDAARTCLNIVEPLWLQSKSGSGEMSTIDDRNLTFY